jgi:dTDP-4-dehydrorhamnose reductase
MRLLITGLSGTLAPHLAVAAQTAGHEVLGWDRSAVPPEDATACAAWLEATRPDAIAHLAMGSPDWAARLAAHAAARARPIVFTSSAMVFHHEPDGPHAPGDERSARDDYGRYKMACEDAVRSAHAGATIARIGWQIDARARGNNMLAHLDQWHSRDGRIGASRAWTPACSFIADTAAALLALIEQPRGGVVHLDSNAREGHAFDAIVAALAERFERAHWAIAPNDDYRHDQRLVGHEALMPPLAHRLPTLRG